MSTHHVVMFSGGAGSWAAAKRVAAAHPGERLTLLFTDTRTEDEDLYRFLAEAAANVEGADLVTLADGRDVWQVFFDSRFLGNTRVSNCSRILKQEPARRWVEENCDPASTVLYVGIGWDEEHRLPAVTRNWQPYRVEAPMCEAPYLDRDQVFAWLAEEGIARPRLYDLGMAHNNCGGFCVRAGQAHFKRLLEVMPERYAHHEAKEEELRQYLDADVAILRDRRGGTTKPLTLRAFREQVQGQAEALPLFAVDAFDIGGCGCFFSDETEEVGADA